MSSKTTKAEVEAARKEALEAYRYHYSLPDNEMWENAMNFKRINAKFQMLNEAFKMGM